MNEHKQYGAWMARFGFCAGMLFGAWSYSRAGWTGTIVVASLNLLFSVVVVVVQTLRATE